MAPANPLGEYNVSRTWGTTVLRTMNATRGSRYNNIWVLQCGDVHPNPGHRRIYQLRRNCRLVPGPPVPLLDIEEYAQHLVVNTNRRYDSLDNTTNAQDQDMKLATWNIQGAQGSITLQRWASVLHLISQCRIDLCGIQEYHPCLPKPEAATTVLNNDYKCYAAPGNVVGADNRSDGYRCAVVAAWYPPPPLVVPHPREDGPPPPPGVRLPSDGPPPPHGRPHHHRTCTFAGTEIAAKPNAISIRCVPVY